MKRSTGSAATDRSSTRPLTARPSSPKSDWRLYAAACAAALAAVGSADAAIITGNANLDLKLPGAAPFGANAAATGKFVIGTAHETASVNRHRMASNSANVHGDLKISLINSSANTAKDFTRGSLVTHAYQANRGFLLLVASLGPSARGYGGVFPLNHTALIGFQLPNGDDGWLRVDVIDRNNDGFPDELKAMDWAYNNVPGGSINAGESAAVPEPSALGLLAIGSAAVLAWRRQRTPVAGVSKAR